MNRKVFLKRSTEDLCSVCEDYEYVELNEINAALTASYWSQWSPTPLKTMLIKRFGRIRNMYLRLDVACEHNSMIVKSIAIKCALRDADDRSWIIGCIDELDWIGRAFRSVRKNTSKALVTARLNVRKIIRYNNNGDGMLAETNNTICIFIDLLPIRIDKLWERKQDRKS